LGARDAKRVTALGRESHETLRDVTADHTLFLLRVVFELETIKSKPSHLEP